MISTFQNSRVSFCVCGRHRQDLSNTFPPSIYISPVLRPGVGWSADDGSLPAAAGQRKHREGSSSHLRNCILPPFIILKDDDNRT